MFDKKLKIEVELWCKTCGKTRKGAAFRILDGVVEVPIICGICKNVVGCAKVEKV